MALTKEEILKAEDGKPKMVACPEWGGDVAVYPLTNSQLEEMERWNDENPLGVGFRYKLLSLALGSDWTEDDIRRLGDKQGSVVKRLSEAAARMCDDQLPAEEEATE